MKDPYTAYNKTLMKDTEEDTNKWNFYTRQPGCRWTWTASFFKK